MYMARNIEALKITAIYIVNIIWDYFFMIHNIFRIASPRGRYAGYRIACLTYIFSLLMSRHYYQSFSFIYTQQPITFSNVVSHNTILNTPAIRQKYESQFYLSLIETQTNVKRDPCDAENVIATVIIWHCCLVVNPSSAALYIEVPLVFNSLQLH